MPAITDLVVNDREATPVSHTFTPDGDLPGGDLKRLREYTGTPVGNSTVILGCREAANNYVAELRLKVPSVQVQTVNGVSSPVVVGTCYVNVKATFPHTSTEQDRKNAIGMIANALDPSQSMVNDVFTKLQHVY